MKSLKAMMFNRAASNPKNKPDEVLYVLRLQQGQIVADIGAGGGYFSLRFAEIVGKNGRVLAVDTSQNFLEYIKNEAKKKGLENIETILVTGEKLSLPEQSLDLIFIRNVYHHLRNRVEYFRKIRHFLKLNGKVAIIERNKSLTLHGIFGHYVPKETIIKEMEEAGYLVDREFDFLPNHSFIIFCPKQIK